MIASIFNFIINLLASIIQIICTPINIVIENSLPDLTTWINNVNIGLGNIISNMSWALGIIPPIVIEFISFVLLIEIAKHTIFKSTHILSKIWDIIQKIKFW